MNFPIRGIREELPEGEHVLWQGAPAWRSLARSAFHVRKLVVYFAAILVLRIAFSMADGQTLGAALGSSVDLFVLALATIAVLHVIAWLSASTTVYAITDRRVVMRVGIALPVIVNLPLNDIAAAGLKVHGDESGDMPLQLKGEDVRLAYAVLWPHVRRWRFAHPEPMMRGVANGVVVARILAQALAAVNPARVSWSAEPTCNEQPISSDRIEQPQIAVAA